MDNLKKYSFKKPLVFLVVFSMILCSLGMMTQQAAYAEEVPIALTVTGDGVEQTIEFTLDDLEALQQKTDTYAGYNRWPSLNVFEDMTGPTLQSILDTAGLKENATLIKFKEAGDVYNYFTKKEILDTPRYYFPNGGEGSEKAAPNGNEAGKVRVETIIALNEADGKLVYGQLAPHELTVCKSLMLEEMCLGGTIEVMTTPLEQWAMPDAYPGAGVVAPNAEVNLQYQEGLPQSAIVYYTLDGSEPTVKSQIFNISYPTFQPELNGPIVIDKDLTIKTRTIGYGKLDSEVATYQYTIQSGQTNNQPGTTFSDIENNWAKADIELLASKHFIKGKSETTFAPNSNITRAEFAALLVRALGLEEGVLQAGQFKDVSGSEWYAGSVAAATGKNIIKGDDNNCFKPNDNITRQEMAVMIARAARVAGKEKTLSISEQEQQLTQFKDRQAIPAWAEKEVALVANAGIIQGMPSGDFSPQMVANRAQSAVMLKRFLMNLNLITID